MKKMSLATGALTLLGFLLVLSGICIKLLDWNFLAPMVSDISRVFLAANTCFLVALIVSKFE